MARDVQQENINERKTKVIKKEGAVLDIAQFSDFPQSLLW